jgi:hypothetical protein
MTRPADSVGRERAGWRVPWFWALLVVVSGAVSMGYALYWLVKPH